MICLRRKSNHHKLWGTNKAEAYVVVAIRRIVVVTIRHTTVPSVVVPTTTADHAVATP